MPQEPNELTETGDGSASIFSGSNAAASSALEMRCTCAVLRRATRRLTQVYDEGMRPSGLKLTQYSVLSTLAQAEDPSITDLAERLMMDRTTLTRNLGPLAKAGWVRIGRGSDARSRAVTLTGAGREVLEAARPVWRQTEVAVRQRLGADGGRALRQMLAEASAAVAGEGGTVD